MRRLAVLSLHTSPLAQPGTGDGGGMNVYVRELSSALAHAGVFCDVYTRRDDPDLPDTVFVEPGFEVHHVAAGPAAPVAKEHLFDHVEEFTEHVVDHLTGVAGRSRSPGTSHLGDVDEMAGAIHANYWLSGVAGHAIKHRLDLPLVSTFHTLDRVKAEASPEEAGDVVSGRRARLEAEIIGCSDALCASCSVEVDQLVELYGANPGRIDVVPPAVDHAFFSPGDRYFARRALGLEREGPLLLYVGRIQPLKGADVAVRALSELHRAGRRDARLVVVGGPSGPRGESEVASLHRLVEEEGLAGHVAFWPPQRHELLSTFYRAADCCIVPSRSESFGLVALEAAACGVPVVAAAVGGLTTLVEDGVTGYLVEPGDAAGFARHVAEIVGDEGLRARLSKAASAMAAGYTWATAAAALAERYRELASRALVQC
ncbi:MAG TPA: glycosyltransferase [Acidimicrobiales bacterium]|nr:glycosyltransferase [Acidimicrobiales bacterium]